MARLSIERRLLITTACLFLVIGSVLALTVRAYARRAADEAFDRVLTASALSIADTVGIEEGAVTVDIPYSAFAILGTSRLNRVFYRVTAPDGSLVTGSPILALDIPVAEDGMLHLHDSVYRGDPVRIASVRRYRADPATGTGGWIGVMVAETREARRELAGQLTFNGMLPAVAIALLSGGLILVSVRSAFSPLRLIESNLRARRPSDLSRIEREVPAEVSALVSALNEFMDRLGSVLDGVKRVTADAAHQLRTPLAAIQAQAEVGLEEAQEPKVRRRLSRIHHNAREAGLLANMLLSDATTMHRLETQDREIVDFGDAVRDALQMLRAESAYVRLMRSLVLVMQETPVPVVAEPVVLREMVRNVIENAFIHAPGPTDVNLAVVEGRATLQVMDRGPGIPDAAKDKVFQRFARADSSHPGTGLGLAIAKDVAVAFGGSISVADRAGGGLVVEVALPVVARSGGV
ncbi:sensor histidine kinase [Shinella sp. S4-D37]|uniref:sensor histidine kinase n=1 Tax=Shinella sp. S4-D37 TaxID=3161999 RepID=UPI003464F952